MIEFTKNPRSSAGRRGSGVTLKSPKVSNAMAKKPITKRKAAQKQDREEAKAVAKAGNALANFPADEKVIRSEFSELEALKKQTAGAAGEVGAFKKRLQETYGMDAVTIMTVQRLRGLKDGRRESVIRQVNHLIEALGLNAQLDLFDERPAQEAAVQPQAAAPAPAKGRGRPPASKAPPPPASAAPEALESPINSPMKRGRGRPKGSKNAVKAIADGYVKAQNKKLGKPAKAAKVAKAPAPKAPDPLEGSGFVLN